MWTSFDSSDGDDEDGGLVRRGDGDRAALRGDIDVQAWEVPAAQQLGTERPVVDAEALLLELLQCRCVTTGQLEHLRVALSLGDEHHRLPDLVEDTRQEHLVAAGASRLSRGQILADDCGDDGVAPEILIEGRPANVNGRDRTR